jgi:hypothetical protein
VTLHQKVDGAWVQASRAYVLRNGVWTSVSEAWVKSAGVWKKAFTYDATPPLPPEITLSISEDRSGAKLLSRWIRVGVRIPGAANDPNVQKVRILTNYEGKAPTTVDGGTTTKQPDSTYPDEWWSEWRYNQWGVHKDTSAYVYKQWPRNASGRYIIPGDKTYFFTGWTMDQDGNWGTPTAASIKVPKSAVDAPNIVIKEATLRPTQSGSWTSAGFQSGNLIQQRNPTSTGLWFYGTQFVDSIGAQTSSSEHIKVKDAQIWVSREDDDGQANANIYLFWTDYGSVAALPAAGIGIVRHEPTKIGTLAKGQADWFTLPAAYYDNLNKSIKGLGLDGIDPVKAAAFPEDYSSVKSQAAELRCGQVHITWQETL